MLRHLKRPRKNSPYTVWIRAFGEEKTAQEWGHDPRCVHRDGDLIASRVRAGMDAEQAIATPRNYSRFRAGGPEPSDEPPAEGYEEAMRRTLTAFGETMTIAEWLSDERCEWDSAMVIAKRLDAGFAGEVALNQLPKISGRLLEAFGELKTMADWSRDPRCLYGPADLRRRLGRGMSFERALSEPLGFLEASKTKRFRFTGELLTAFGESKTMRDWACDPRCLVNSDTLGQRLREGWSLERALTDND